VREAGPNIADGINRSALTRTNARAVLLERAPDRDYPYTHCLDLLGHLGAGGGGARGARRSRSAALFEANVRPPRRSSDQRRSPERAASIRLPSLAGTMMLREVWMSRRAQRLPGPPARPPGFGIRRDQLSPFQHNVSGSWTAPRPDRHLQVEICVYRFAVVATDLNAGKPRCFAPASYAGLLASTAIPACSHGAHHGLGSTSTEESREHATEIAIDRRRQEILAISLMAGGEREQPPAGFGELIARTLQLSLITRC